jgi:hypothetical protein
MLAGAVIGYYTAALAVICATMPNTPPGWNREDLDTVRMTVDYASSLGATAGAVACVFSRSLERCSVIGATAIGVAIGLGFVVEEASLQMEGVAPGIQTANDYEDRLYLIQILGWLGCLGGFGLCMVVRSGNDVASRC